MATPDPAVTGSFRGIRFHQRDLSGATFDSCTLEGARFRDCNLSNVVIVASWVEDLRVSSPHGQGSRILVDDVDVSAYVAAELDRRFPERVLLRSLAAPEDYRHLFAVLQDRWGETLARAERLPESARHQRVDDEWSLVETLRHLVFADDCWISRQYFETEAPFHPLGLPPTDYEGDQAAELGLDGDADPTFAEVLDVLRTRWERLGALLDDVTRADLDRHRTAVIAPAWGQETHPGAACLRVVLEESSSHRRYVERDLATVEAGLAEPPAG